ncbi:MAG: hypothetical protein ACQEXJ_10970 [Myxococcota bacterium]
MSTAIERDGTRRAGIAPVHWVDHAPEVHSKEPDRAWLRAAYGLGQVFYERDEGPPPPERLRWLVWQVDDFMARVGGQTRLVFRLSLFLVTWIAPLLVFRPPTLHRLPKRLRYRALERYERSPLAPTLLAVKAALSILYYEHPDAAREIGVDGRAREDAS